VLSGALAPPTPSRRPPSPAKPEARDQRGLGAAGDRWSESGTQSGSMKRPARIRAAWRGNQNLRSRVWFPGPSARFMLMQGDT